MVENAKLEKQIACNDVVPGCSFEASAPTEGELLQKVGEHARKSHGVVEMTPELAVKVKEAIRSR